MPQSLLTIRQAQTPTTKIRITCAACGARGAVPQRYSGRRIRCLSCRQTLRVPTAGWSARHPVVRQPGEVRHYRQAELALEPERTRSTFARFPEPQPISARERRDVDHERHVHAIGFGWQLGGVLQAIGALVFTLLLLGAQAPLGAFLTMTVSAGFAAALWLVGTGLREHRNWARWVVVALAGLNLLLGMCGLVANTSAAMAMAFVINLAWNGSIIAVLIGARGGGMFDARYRQQIECSRSTRIPWWTSPFFWIPIVLVIVSLVALMVLVGSTVFAFAGALKGF